MKKIIFLLITVFSVSLLQAQEQQNTPAAQLAHHIADKMKDTLALTNQQRAMLFKINMELYHKKMMARKKSTDRNIVGAEIQSIEKSRDTLYKEMLSAQQYQGYMQKKRNLVTTN